MHEKEKLNEARFFVAKMVGEKEDPIAFKHYLSACLSSARSVMQYALDEAKGKKGGKKWYEGWMSSKILGFFKEKRDYNIHTAPLPLKKHIKIMINETIRVTESLHIEVKDKDGNILETRDVIEPPAPTEPEGSSAVSESRYEFDDWTGEDVISLCDKYLTELERFIQDGQAKGYISG